MDYKISKEQFYTSKMFDSKGKFYHKSGYRFKLFPFVTQSNSEPVLDLENLVGSFLCMIEGKTAKEVTPSLLSDMLKEETEIEAGQDELFGEMVRQMFFNPDGTMRPLNLELLEQKTCSETSEHRIVEYLVDVLGDKDVLKANVEEAKDKAHKESNVLERLVLDKLQYEEQPVSEQDISYFRIINSLKGPFEEDFAHVLDNPKRSREYLVSLLELYFFTYTAQAILQLNRFLDGERNDTIPLYFCLEWEKTSQSRLCFSEGWKKLQIAIEKMFAHVIVLEMLNQTEEGAEQVDYIKIKDLLQTDEIDVNIAKQIDIITECYRSAITDCAEMNELKKGLSSQSPTAASLQFLFDSVRTQFENTARERAYNSYASKYESFCHKYLKSRGRSGLMLNLSEESLIFLTKLCIKNRDQMRLKDVFAAFERRGIFLDSLSKEQVAAYYEKLNLIEKKSDSGDAKYVKRIL